MTTTNSTPALPEGWVMVPRKPTEEMLEDGYVAMSDDDGWPDNFRLAWSAMLAAAPSPPTNESVGLLAQIEAEARRYAGFYKEASDGRNTFVIFADYVANLAVSAGANESVGAVEREKLVERIATIAFNAMRASEQAPEVESIAQAPARDFYRNAARRILATLTPSQTAGEETREEAEDRRNPAQRELDAMRLPAVLEEGRKLRSKLQLMDYRGCYWDANILGKLLVAATLSQSHREQVDRLVEAGKAIVAAVERGELIDHDDDVVQDLRQALLPCDSGYQKGEGK